MREEDPEKTVRPTVMPSGLLRLSTGELYRLPQIENVIGRKSERKKADIMLAGNPELSREHAVIYQYQGKFMIRDCGSLVGTTIGGKPVSQNTAVPLSDLTTITMAGEDFLFLTGNSLKTLCVRRKLCWIQSLESGEKKLLLENRVPLDRLHPLADGLLAKETVSRKHLLLEWSTNRYTARDLGSSNGSRVRDTALSGGESAALHPGDLFWVYDVGFSYSELDLKGDANKA